MGTGKARHKLTEAQIEAQIIQTLSLLGWICDKTDSGQAARYGGRGRLVVGCPDLICSKNGRAIHLEVKTPEGKLIPQQILEHERRRAAGVPVYVVRSVEDAIEAAKGNQ